MPLNAFAYLAEQPASLTLISEDGSEQQIDIDSWTERFPYGTFAFSNSELTLAENGEPETIRVFRLGGTKGKVTARIAYTPFVADNDGATTNTNAIGENDVEILVEDPAPDAKYQKTGKDRDPFAAPDEIVLSLSDANPDQAQAETGGTDAGFDNTVYLSANIGADSYQWYANYSGTWQIITDAVDAALPIAEEDLQYVDIRLEYMVEGQTYCTDSYYGEVYVQDNDYYDPSEIVITNDYDPTYTNLNLTTDHYGNVCFDLTFAEGEWVKEIIIRPLDNGESDPVRLATFTIYDCDGGELYDSANTLLLTLLDNEASEAAVFGFEVTEVFGDICAGKVRVAVKRTGGMNHVSTIDFATQDDTAVSGLDYAGTSGTLWFYGDVDEQVIEIDLINSNLLANEANAAENMITPEDLSQEEKENLKKFNIILSNIKGGEGKDIIDEEKATAVVHLYESGKLVNANTASLLYDPNAVDVSANAYHSGAALIPSSDPLEGEAIAREEVRGIETSIGDAPASPMLRSVVSAYPDPTKEISFSRASDASYISNYWRDNVQLANSNENLKREDSTTFAWPASYLVVGPSVSLSSTDGAAVAVDMPNMAQLYSSIFLNMEYYAYSVPFSSSNVYPKISVLRGGTEAFSDTGKYTSYRDTTSYNNFTWTFGADDSLSALQLRLIESDSKSGLGTAYCKILDGYLQRRAFENKNLNVVVHTANDANNAQPQEARDAVSFSGKAEIVAQNGGVNSGGNIYVGSQIKVTPTLPASYTFSNATSSLYLTNASNIKVVDSNGGGRDTGGTYRIFPMLWNGFNAASLTDKYTVNLVYNRTQTININLSRSVIENEDETLEVSTAKAVKDFKDSVSGGQIMYGYKNYDPDTARFENATGSIDVSSISNLLTEISRTGVNNFQWIRFNLPAEDLIVYGGKTYTGNETIYLDTADFAGDTVNFLFYDSEALGIEKEAQVLIDSAYVYVDMNGDGKISGYLDETNQFVLDGNDALYTKIDLNTNDDEGVFAPIEIDGVMCNKIMKVFYTVVPRCITYPLGKETVTGQILPAFTHNVTEPAALLNLTKEQKEYRFIAAAKGTVYKDDAEKYLSDEIMIYTASATKLSMIDFPLGGDASPYEINGSNVTWEPDFRGNLLFAYTNPEPITLTNTILGGDLDLTTDYDYASDTGYTYKNGSESKINGYLGSYVGKSVFSLVIREQNQDETMQNLVAGSNGEFTTVFDSVTLGGKGTFPAPHGLLHMDSGTTPSLDFNSTESATAASGLRRAANDGGDIPDGFEIDMGIDLPQLNFENFLGFDGISFYMEGNRIGFAVGTPVAGISFSDPSKAATDNVKENWNLPDKFGQKQEIYDKAARNAPAGSTQGTNGGVTSKDMGISFSVSAAFFWEYDPVQDSFVFSEAALSAKGSFEFSLQYRFAFCPLLYIYVKTGIGVGIGLGLGREYVEVEKTTAATLYEAYNSNVLSDSLGASVTLSSSGNAGAKSVAYFETDAKALNLYYSGKLLVEFLDSAGNTLRKGTITSNNTGTPETINIDKTVKNDLSLNSYIVKVTALTDSTISKVKEVTHYDDIVYFKGFSISPDLFIEIGAGIGIDILKAEVYIKVSVEAAFTFGGYIGYYNNQRNYKGTQVESFDFSAAVGIRAVFLLFTYELTGAGFHVSYEDGEWDHGWTFWNDYGRSGRSMLNAGSTDAIKPPQSAAHTQQLYQAAVSEFQAVTTRFSAFTNASVPFQLSRYSAASSANALAENMSLGYDYQLVTAQDRNFLVYTISRASVTNDIDASMLVLSELVEGSGGYGLTNPADHDAADIYIPIDDDGTGDTDFDVYTDGGCIYVTWLNYKEATTTSAAPELRDAVSNIELRRAVFDLADATVDASEVVSGTDLVATSSTLDNAAAYVAPTLYTDTEYATAYDAYAAYVDNSYAFGGDASAAAKMKELMTTTWAMRAQTEGKASTIKLAYYTDAWNETTVPLPAGFRVTGLDMIQSGDLYLLSYLAEHNTYVNDEYVTYKRLYLTSVDVTGTAPVILSKIIKTIVDYDLSSDKDGEVDSALTLTTPISNPLIGYPRFIEGKLTNGGSLQPLLLYDYCGNTSMIDAAGIEDILAEEPFATTQLFDTADGQASGKVEANIGVDGNGNVSVVYVSTVRGTSNNAIFVSKYDSDSGTFGEGQLLAMNNLQVYEDSFGDLGREWSSQQLEKAYYGELEGYNGGSLSDFSFSNLQVAYGKQEDVDENGSLLILASGSLSELLGDANGGMKYVKEGSTTTGFYALNFGVGNAAVGNQQIIFFEESFSAGSNLSADVYFENTGDVSFRASDAYPATVSLYAGLGGGGQLLIDRWTVEETVAVGRSVNLSMKTPKLLESSLPAGSEFYVEIAENSDAYGDAARTASTLGNGYTIEYKTELEIADFTAHVQEVNGDNVVLNVEFIAQNSGGKNSDQTFVQFTYKASGNSTDGDYESDAVYKPIDITGHTLSTGTAVLLQSFTASSDKGVYELPGGLTSGYSRKVAGTITVSKDQFNALSEGNFWLRAELFDGANASYDDSGMVVANADEYNLYNNYETLPVLPKTFFSVANNIAVSMGNTYKLPVEAGSTKHASKITVEELVTDDTAQVLNQLYYDTLGFVNVMGGAEGSGIMRIADVSTNDFKDIAFRMTGGTGINIYRTNGIFSFCNKDGSAYDPASVNPSDWRFMDSVLWWSGVNEIPLSGDLAISQTGGYFEFTTFANEIDLYFDGSVTIYSDKYADFLDGKTCSASNVFAPTKITFSALESFHSHTVRIVANTNDTAFDKLIEYYEGDTPVPPSAKGGPTILWSRSIAEPGSIENGGAFNVSAYIYDVAGISAVMLNDLPVDGSNIDKLSDELWRVDFTLTDNSVYLLSATNKGSKTSYDSFTLEAFAQVPEPSAKAFAPPFSTNYLDENNNPVTGSINGEVYLEIVNDDTATYPDIEAKVYFLLPDDSSDKGYSESEVSALAGNDLKFELPANGYYKVMVSADDGTWRQEVVFINYMDADAPVVVLREETNRNFDGVDESQRHLFYYASKASVSTDSRSQANVNTMAINNTDLNITPGLTVYGYQHISYGGTYTLEAHDDAGNSKEVSVEINDFRLYPHTGVIERQTPSTLQTGGNGSLTIDLSKITGGNYAGGSSLADYYGSYEAAVVGKASAFDDDYSSPEAKEFFAALPWSDSEQFENLASGEYTLYLRDKTDLQFERNITIAALDFSIGSSVLSANLEISNASGPSSHDGKVTVYPNSASELAKYEVALVSRGAQEPQMLIAPADVDSGAWKEVTEANTLNQQYYAYANLAAGWYQLFVKTDAMDAAADADKIYTELVQVPANKPSESGGGSSRPTTVTPSSNVSVNETDTALIITYPENYYDLEQAMKDRVLGANSSKAIIISANDVYVSIPAGVLNAKDDIDKMVADTSGASDQPYNVVYYTDELGNKIIVPFSNVSSGKVTYIANVCGNYGLMNNRKLFGDTQNHWASESIDFVTARELFNGLSETRFAPDATMTRAMFVTVLGRLAGVDVSGYNGVSFNDVEANTWYSPYVEWASVNGIVSGYGDGRFGTNDSVTREQMCVIIMNLLKHMGIEPELNNTAMAFADAAELSVWAKEAVAYCYRAGIVSGMGDNIFSPQDTATRAQVAAILTNVIKRALGL